MDGCRSLREGERKSERAEKEERSGPSGGIDTETVLERERERISEGARRRRGQWMKEKEEEDDDTTRSRMEEEERVKRAGGGE